MPDPKVVKRGSVASIINNLHKLEYESGRLDQPTPPKLRNTLTSDHPAQRPRGDRPVPFHERPVLRHCTPEPSEAIEGHHSFEIPELKHYESIEKEREEKPNPFRRRDSTASSVSPTPQPLRRESISHRAFERVRVTSPPLAMPVPRVEISPWHESAEQYITRKLTERWSPSHSEPRIARDVREREKGLESLNKEREHLDAPLVQEVLGYIDRILVEHTGTLRSVVEESRRVLREKEVVCVGDKHLSNGRGEDDWCSYTSSVPELLEVVDRTAEKMGLELPEYDISQSRNEGLVRALSPTSPRQRHMMQTSQRHRESDDAHTFASARPSAYNLHAFPSHEEMADDGRGLRSAYEISHHSHSSHPSQSSHYSDTYRPSPSPSTSQRRPSQPHPQSTDPSLQLREDHPSAYHQHSFSYLPNNHTLSHDSLTYQPQPHISPSPSPAFVEYERFAALADRACRNSITDLINTSEIHGPKTESVLAEAGSSGTQARRESHAVPGEEGKEASVAVAEEKKKGKKRVGDGWMQKSNEPSAKGKLKREGTMNRLASSGLYESRVRKRVKVPEPPSASAEAEGEIKPVAKTGKRATERMMASIMTRQGREKEGSNTGRKN